MPAIEHAVSRKTLFESPWIALEAPDIDYVPGKRAHSYLNAVVQ